MGKATKRPKGSNNNKTKQQRGGTAPWPKQPAATAGTDDTKGPPKSTSSKGGRQHQHHQHLLPSPRLVQLPMRILHLVVVYIAGPRPTPTGVPPPSPLPLAFSCRTMHDVVFSCTLLWLTPTPLELLQCPGAALVWHPPGPPPSDRATAFARLIAWRPRTLDLSRFTRTEQVTVLRRASAPLRAAVAHVRFPAYAQTHDAFRPAALLAMVLYPRSFPGLCALSISLWTLRGVRSDWADTGLATVVQPVRLVIEGHPPPHDVPVLDVVLDAWAGRMSQFLGGTGSGSKDASSSSLAAALRAGSMLPSTAIPVSAIVPTAFPHLVASIPKSSPYLSWTKCRHCKVRFASAGSKTCTPVDPETAAAPRSRRSVATVHRLTSVSRSHGGRTITHAVAAAPSPQSIPKQPNTKPTDGTDPDPMPVPAWYMDAVADAAEDELPGPDGARMVDARDPNVTLAEATAYYPCPGELDPRAFLAGAGPGSHHGCGCGVVASSNGNHHHHHGSSSLSSSSSSTSSSSSSMSEGRRGTAHDDDDDDDDDDDEGISQPCTHSMNQHYHRRGTPASATGFHGGPPPGLCEHFIEERLVPELATSPTTAANGTAIDASIVPVMPHADFQIVHDACMESDHGPPRPAAPATVPCNALVRRGLCFACLVRYEPDVQQCAVSIAHS
ncbi:hypothetical protein BC828DRAFT_407851 [Blastocladiella britannica]|nr:hypothetical protein BC828DRAFT_407851 [Blastocladiella britannica]